MSTPTETPVGCPYTFGKTTIGLNPVDNSGYLDVNKYTLIECGTVESLSLYVAATAGGRARMALYTDISGTPGSLLAESAAVAVSVGWNVIDIPDTLLAPGNYWIGVQTEAGVQVVYDNGVSGDDPYMTFTFGAFPAVLPVMSPWNALYSMYASYCQSSCPSPTATPTVSPTASITPTFVGTCVCPDYAGKSYDSSAGVNIFGWMAMNWYGVSEDGNAQSISVRVVSGSGNMRVAVYTNAASAPGTLLARSASTAVTAGWNTINIEQVSLLAGNIYWLAIQMDNASMNVGRDPAGSAGDEAYVSYPYNEFPGTAPVMGFSAGNWDIRVNYCPLVCPVTPTETWTPIPGASPTDTPAATLTYTEINTATMTPVITPTFTNTIMIIATNTNTPVNTSTNVVNPAAMLDDMDDNDNANNWSGYWYTYDDLPPGNPGTSYVVPWSDNRWNSAGQTPQAFFMQGPGYNGTGYAARMTGFVTTAFTYGFVGMGTAFIDPKGPVDLSTCGGIRFWEMGDGKSYRMKVSSGSPLFASGTGDNHYGYQFVSHATWFQRDVPFTSLTQETGWGSVVSLASAMAMATDIQWQTTGQPIASIDLWIDEVEIYGCASYPTPPVTTPTNTPVNPVTPVASFTSTATMTNTVDVSASTPTPTPGPELLFSEKTPVISFPNPGFLNPPGAVQTPVTIDFTITKAGTDVFVKIYSSSARCVRTFKKAGMTVNGAIGGNLVNGRNVISIDGNEFLGLSQGTYFYVITCMDGTKNVKSKVEKMIIIKK